MIYKIYTFQYEENELDWGRFENEADLGRFENEAD